MDGYTTPPRTVNNSITLDEARIEQLLRAPRRRNQRTERPFTAPRILFEEIKMSVLETCDHSEECIICHK
jgi:hypothetical protein